MQTTQTKIAPWRARPDLMDRLTKVQNAPKNSGRDIMTFAGFMDTEDQLEAYVAEREAA